jgi:hypothetical protein
MIKLGVKKTNKVVHDKISSERKQSTKNSTLNVKTYFYNCTYKSNDSD